MKVLDLAKINSRDILLVGGKAASLGEMLNAGINVPGGFVITTDSGAVMDKKLREQILKRFEGLNVEFVAVRSSAVAEDSKDASWAGQLDTFLNVTKANLIDYIEKCWASIRSERALAYAEQNDISSDANKVAVIVQEMIQSDVAGVAFSVNPVSGNKDEVVIEAVFGLGEALVSGQLTPDNYILSKNGELVSKNISSQDKMLSKVEDQTRWSSVYKDKAGSRKLSNLQLAVLLEQVKKIESHYGFPVDIEWVIKGDDLFIAQSRPITTL